MADSLLPAGKRTPDWHSFLGKAALRRAGVRDTSCMRIPSGNTKFDVSEMLSLRVLGWSSPQLARRYGVDHSTILYHCKRFGAYKGGAEPAVVAITREREVREPPRKADFAVQKAHKYEYVWNEATNPGKRSYRDYEREAMQRPAESHYRKTQGRERGLSKRERRRYRD